MRCLLIFSFLIEVEVSNGIVTLSNAPEILRTSKSIREKIESLIREIEGVNEIKFAEKTGDKKDHVNYFYNIN